MKYESASLEETGKIAKKFVLSIESAKKDAQRACIVGLYGDLGSGKTSFTQAVARELGVTETVTSPTFVIEKIYKLEHQSFQHLIHIDAYRLEKSNELEKLGWQEIIRDPKNLIFIEWPERVVDIMPEDMQKIYFKFIDEKTREIRF